MVINPEQYLINKHEKRYIEDCYFVEIRLSEHDSFGLPKVYDLDKRAEAIARKIDKIKSVKDLHVDESGCCCLGIFSSDDEVNKYQNLPEFLDLVVNFLYRLSFVEKFKKEPWENYEHGKKGLAQYADDFHLLLEKPDNKKIYEPCSCGSGKKYKWCCMKLSNRLRKAYK